MPPERDLVRLVDMLEAAKEACSFVEGLSWEAFERDRIVQGACIYKIVVIGEAARVISQEFKEQHPDMDWRIINGMRNKVVHEYGSINLLIVWDVLQNHLPALIAHLTTLLPPEQHDG